MLKHLMNGSSLLALALRDRDSDGADDRTRLREQIAKGNLPVPEKEVVASEEKEEVEEAELDDDEEDGDEDGEEKEELTSEEKAEAEAKAKIEAKAKRKNDRMQSRIDEATAARRTAEAEVARLKAQLEADPEKKLTPEEIETRAEAIATKKIADKELADAQIEFEAACDKLQKEARKIDKAFDNNVNDMATQFGPIPSFMIRVLEDFENGAELLTHIAAEEEVAEHIYSLQTRPAKMIKELVELSNKLAAAKKPLKKEISKVPDPGTTVKGSRTNGSTVITEADTKNMEVYARKRRAQQEEAKKARGY